MWPAHLKKIDCSYTKCELCLCSCPKKLLFPYKGGRRGKKEMIRLSHREGESLVDDMLWHVEGLVWGNIIVYQKSNISVESMGFFEPSGVMNFSSQACFERCFMGFPWGAQQEDWSDCVVRGVNPWADGCFSPCRLAGWILSDAYWLLNFTLSNYLVTILRKYITIGIGQRNLDISVLWYSLCHCANIRGILPICLHNTVQRCLLITSWATCPT